MIPDVQKCKPVNVDGAVVAADGIPKATRKPALKKATVKPTKPEAVIEISSDSEEQIKKDNNKPRKKSDRNATTLTSTLTARSKVNKRRNP